MAITGWLERNRAQVRLAVRMTVACFVTYVLSHAIELDQSQWAVLTAIIVMQGSVGGSLKAMLDRLVGSLGGAVAGVAVSVGLHYLGIDLPGAALAIGLPPLAVLGALKPAYRVTPVTFIILILTPNLQELGPIASAYERMLEIAVGSAVALVVALTVLPARAHDALAQAVSQALAAMADMMRSLPGGMQGDVDDGAVNAGHARIRAAIAKAETAAEEAIRERASHLSDGVDPLPVCRTLRRLRHDIAILGRTMTAPLPDPVEAIMAPPIVDVAQATARFLEDASRAFADRRPAPSLAQLDAVFLVQSQAVTAIRRQGLSRDLPDEDLARIFGLGFALAQLRRDLGDLAERGIELAGRVAAPPQNSLA